MMVTGLIMDGSEVLCINMTGSEGNNLYEKINYGSFSFAMGKHDSIGRVFFS